MEDAMSHQYSPGVALSFLFGFHVCRRTITGMIAILLLVISHLVETKPYYAIGISFTAFLAFGIIIISLRNMMTDLYHILFGKFSLH